MKKLLFLIIFFYAFLMSMNLFPAERVTHHLILGGKIHGHFSVRKDSPYVPVEGSGKGGGIGFYAEVIPFPYASFESGFYLRSFNLGHDVSYTELQFPGIGKFRYHFSDRFAMSIGGVLPIASLSGEQFIRQLLTRSLLIFPETISQWPWAL